MNLLFCSFATRCDEAQGGRNACDGCYEPYADADSDALEAVHASSGRAARVAVVSGRSRFSRCFWASNNRRHITCIERPRGACASGKR